jgi:hypothetical protein
VWGFASLVVIQKHYIIHSGSFYTVLTPAKPEEHFKVARFGAKREKVALFI